MSFHLNILSDFWQVLLLSIPLIIGGVLHMVIVKKDILSYFKKPIHQSWFGQNKTWRGFVVMPLLTWPGVLLSMFLEKDVEGFTLLFSGYSSWVFALVLGFSYCLAELPNSFMKRRLGIKEGKTASKGKWFFILFDQADSALGCLFAYKIMLSISWSLFWETLLFGTVLHLVINRSLYLFGLRKNPY